MPQFKTKSHVIEGIRERLGADVTKSQAEKAYDAFVDALVHDIKTSDGVQLRELGTFRVRHRKERLATKPGTKEPVIVKARNVVSFRQGKALSELI